jgi:tetratricopeptide (TPR) repeat protein
MKAIITSLFIIVGISFAMNGYAQKDQKVKKESYKSLKLRSSSTEIDQLLKEAERLKTKSPGDALKKVQEALGMSLAQQDAFNEGRCYLLLGEINESINEWNLALDSYQQAYQKLTKDFSSSPEYQRTLIGLGNTHLKLGSYDAALTNFQDALKFRLRDTERTERLLDISEVYYQMGNYEEALRTLETPKDSKVVDNSLDARIQNLQAKIYARMNELDKTKDIYENSLNTLRSTKKVDKEEDNSLQSAKEEIVDVLREQKRYDDEIDLRNKSIEYNLESKNLAEVTKDKVEISKTLEAKGETAAAIEEMEEAAAIADTLNDPREQAEAFLALANLYEKNGRNNQALSTFKKYSEAVTKSEKVNQTELEEKSNLLRQQKDIEALTKSVSIGQREEVIERQTVFRQQLIIYGLLFIIAITAVTSYFIYRNAQASKVANQLLALKSLRGQMNPHFIFNALNSVNHFIAQQDERTANKFLSEFSMLMRLVMENSQEDFIPLQKEHEILSLYLKLEHYRFRDKFDYEIQLDNNIDMESIEVPPMLVQPYLENAVWHGLRYKESKGKLMLRFQKMDHSLVVEIEDDGIGRKKSADIKTVNQKKHNSTGLKNIQERLSIINKVYKSNYHVHIEDLPEEAGTKVRVTLPIHKGTNGV